LACSIDLTDLIDEAADAAGVPRAIALSVAMQESGVCQWNPDGSIVTGSSGELGVFQLMPATAAALGVDPTDVNQNIQGGVRFLAQLYQRYADWSLAVQHYNGSGPAAVAYAQQVMARAALLGAGAPPVVALSTVDLSSLPMPLLIGAAAVFLVMMLFD